jgi:hypothetical protein
MIPRMVRPRLLCFFAAALTTAAPALGQKKDDKAADEKKDSAEAKPEKPKSDDDVVIDNRDMGRKKALAAQEEAYAGTEQDSPFAADAQIKEPEERREHKWKPGLGLGFSLGFALPMGDYSSQGKLSDAADGLIFLGAEVGYWFIPHLFAGLGVSGGYVLPACENVDASCSGWQLRGGPLVLVRFDPHANITPAIGVGAGYEWMSLSASTDVVSVSQSAHGFELFNARAGVEVRSRGDLYGVFLSYHMAKFTKQSTSIESDALGNKEDSSDIDSPQNHGWIGLSVRGSM